MTAFIGDGVVGGGFGLLNVVPDSLVVSQEYVSSDGGEVIYISRSPGANGTFLGTVAYSVTFVSEAAVRYTSPYVKLGRVQTLYVAVPQLPLGVYDVEVALAPLDSTTLTDGVTVLKRGYYKSTHGMREGWLSSWDTGPETSSSEEDTLTSHTSNFAVLSATAGELVDSIAGSPCGHSVAAENQSRGFTTLQVRSVYPFVSSIPGKFSVSKGTVYEYTAVDTSANELQGVSVLKGEDKGVTEGTVVWPLVT